MAEAAINKLEQFVPQVACEQRTLCEVFSLSGRGLYRTYEALRGSVQRRSGAEK